MKTSSAHYTVPPFLRRSQGYSVSCSLQLKSFRAMQSFPSRVCNRLFLLGYAVFVGFSESRVSAICACCLLFLQLTCSSSERTGTELFFFFPGVQRGSKSMDIRAVLVVWEPKAEITHSLPSNAPTYPALTQIPQALPLGISLMYFKSISAIKIFVWRIYPFKSKSAL